MDDSTSINFSSLLGGDDPIEKADEDLLQRAALADALAQEIRTTSATHGAVVALTGKWGSGKTSMLNLTSSALEAVADVHVVKFNPWFFSGTDQLMQFFFAELAGQLRDGRGLKDKLVNAGRTVADRLGRYSSALSPLKFIPLAGDILESANAVAEGASKFLGDGQETVHEQREEITRLLADLPGRIVVFVDDIDRLSQQEIRDLFRLVRLTGSFPNIIYVLSFDRRVVEAALSDGAVDGAAYLEKIVKVSTEVPPLPVQALTSVVIGGLVEALDGMDTGPLDIARWTDVLVQVIVPMFSTIRDVKRYLASVPMAVRSLRAEVSLVDVLALEALRVRHPAAHELLSGHVDLLTRTQAIQQQHDQATARERTFVEDFVRLSDGHAAVLVRLLFPAGERLFGGTSYGSDWSRVWDRDRRVACTAILEYYLYRQLPAGRAPVEYIEQVTRVVGDENALAQALKQIPDRMLDDILKRIGSHLGDLPSDQVVPTASALMRQLPRVRLGNGGIFDPGGQWAVLGLVETLLSTLSGEAADQAVTSLFHGITSLNGKLMLLDITTADSGGQNLVSEETALNLKQELRSDYLAATADDLVDERMLLLTVARVTAETDEPMAPQLLNDPRVVACLLESAVAPVHSQTFGSAAVQTENRLHWDALVKAFGGEQKVAEGVAVLRRAVSNQTIEANDRLGIALDLYDKYVEGWRPQR
ncbi:KAP family P-loop NTPase fold protein [Streptomyces goshikiensis]|uniref:KAP family P-loop NTPase fold protein n=1 Tax=Streptomyces goshikiensis TaxID=1942 RepID=UPI0036C2D698